MDVSFIQGNGRISREFQEPRRNNAFYRAGTHTSRRRCLPGGDPEEFAMNIRTFAYGGAAAVAMTSLLGIAPAFAFTHHPATPEEIRQTEQLNAQSLANAQAASAAAASTGSTVNGSTTSGNNLNGGSTNANAPNPGNGATPAQPAPDKPDSNTPDNGQ